jgi:hypothetical protein
VIATNRLLGLGFFISLVSTITVALLTVGITSLSVGMGVIYADLKEVDPNRVFSGFGGLLTMVYGALGVTAVIVFEAYPVYRIVSAQFFGHNLSRWDYISVVCCFLAALGAALTMIIYPLRLGMRRITQLEV